MTDRIIFRPQGPIWIASIDTDQGLLTATGTTVDEARGSLEARLVRGNYRPLPRGRRPVRRIVSDATDYPPEAA